MTVLLRSGLVLLSILLLMCSVLIMSLTRFEMARETKVHVTLVRHLSGILQPSWRMPRLSEMPMSPRMAVILATHGCAALLLAAWAVGALFAAARPNHVSMDSALGFVRVSGGGALLGCLFLIPALLIARVSHWLELFVWDRLGFPFFPFFFLRRRRQREVPGQTRDRAEDPESGTED